jgi:hypothetical protein
LKALYEQMADEYSRWRHCRGRTSPIFRAYLDIGANIDHDRRRGRRGGGLSRIYRSALAARHYNTPMQPDGRLWAEEEICAVNTPVVKAASRAA